MIYSEPTIAAFFPSALLPFFSALFLTPLLVQFSSSRRITSVLVSFQGTYCTQRAGRFRAIGFVFYSSLNLIFSPTLPLPCFSYRPVTDPNYELWPQTAPFFNSVFFVFITPFSPSNVFSGAHLRATFPRTSRWDLCSAFPLIGHTHLSPPFQHPCLDHSPLGCKLLGPPTPAPQPTCYV